MTCHNLIRRVGVAARCSCALAMMFVACMFVPTAKADPANLQTMADVQCLLVGERLVASTDQRQELLGNMLAIYFLGRIDDRSPSVNLEGLLKKESKDMTTSKFGVTANRCGKELAVRGMEITRIGKRLEQLGR